MSKYIIDVGDAYVRHGLERTLTIPVRINEHEDHWMDTRIPVTPYTEPDLEQVRKEAYQQGRKDGKIEGQAEAWVCANKIAFKPKIVECVDDLVRIGFDVGNADSWSEAIELLFEKYSASEAIEKIREYEQEQEKIKVGDEVISPDGKAVVTEISDRNVRIMYSNGSGYVTQLEELTKTGRHFSEISAVLAKMKEES